MVGIRDRCLRQPKITGDGLEVSIILRRKIVGIGRNKRDERTARIIDRAMVTKFSRKIVYGVFALIHRTSVSCCVSIGQKILK